MQDRWTGMRICSGRGNERGEICERGCVKKKERLESVDGFSRISRNRSQILRAEVKTKCTTYWIVIGG